jgi:hypothetical protein
MQAAAPDDSFARGWRSTIILRRFIGPVAIPGVILGLRCGSSGHQREIQAEVEGEVETTVSWDGTPLLRRGKPPPGQCLVK